MYTCVHASCDQDYLQDNQPPALTPSQLEHSSSGVSPQKRRAVMPSEGGDGSSRPSRGGAAAVAMWR